MRPSESWDRETSPWPNREISRIVCTDGISWHVQQTGRGPSMLLVHGTGASTHSWRDVLPVLARSFSVLAIDLPGHGFTGETGPVRSSIAGMSDSLGALLRTLGVNPSHCVGHSAGAVIICRMALDGHIEPRSIVSINGAFVPFAGAAGRLLPPFARVLAGTPYLTRMVARRAGNAANVARVIAGTGSRLDAAGIDFYVRLMSNPQHVAGALRMMGNWDLPSFARELPRLATPLALMVGENDLAVPPRQASMVQQSVMSAAIYRLPGLGHLAHEEQPALVAQRILEICRES